MNRAQNIYEFRRINMHGTKSGPNADPDYAEKYHPGKGNGQTQTGNEGTKTGSGELDSPPVRADGTVRLHHWTWHQNLKEIDPRYHGEGIPGAESIRKERYPDLWVDRSYFGIAPGQEGGYEKEIGLGRHEYIVDIPADRLYDIESDPRGFRQIADDMVLDHGYLFADSGVWLNAYEKVIADNGYAGYWVDTDHMGLVGVVYEVTFPEKVEAWWDLPRELRDLVYPTPGGRP